MDSMILKLVKAARMAARQAEATAAFMIDGKNWTVADELYGQLLDALMLCGEKAGNVIELDEMKNMLVSDMSDGEIALKIYAGSEMPKPHIVDEGERREHAEKNGYYLHRDGDKRSDGEKIVKVYERLNKTTAMLKSCKTENMKMRQIINGISEDRCKECILGRTGVCILDDCKWHRFRNGDFS